MHTNLLSIFSRLIKTDVVLAHLRADNLSQAALAYIRHNYVMDSSLSEAEQDLIETIPAFADNLSDSFRDSFRMDSSSYHLFKDGSSWVKTNAYEQVWADAADFASEILLNRETHSQIDIELLRAVGMEFAILEAIAPALLSALERLVHPMADDDDIEHAKELIAKAKGGQ